MADIIITQNPVPQFLSAGDTGAYSIGVTGSATPHYQWYEAGYTGSLETGITGYTPMSGETGPNLYMIGVTGLQNRARYRCAVDETAVI